MQLWDDDSRDDEREPAEVNPFHRSPVAHFIGRIAGAIDAVRMWITWHLSGVFHWVAWIIGAATYRLEEWFRRVRHGMSRRVEGVIDSRPVQGLGHGWQSLQDRAARSVDDVAHSVQEHTVGSRWLRRCQDQLSRVFMWCAATIGAGWVSFLEWSERSAVLRWLSWPIRFAAYLVGMVAEFGQDWFWTRQFRHLRYGIPALLLLLPMVFCAVRMPFYNQQQKAKHYRAAAQAAMEKDDLVAAELCFRKLAQLGDENERVTMQAALLLEEQGNLEAAYQQVQKLAAPDGSGLPEAYLWIASRIDNKKIEVANPHSMEMIEANLRHAHAQQPTSPDVNLWLAMVCLKSARQDDAVQLVESLHAEWLTPAQRMQAAMLLRGCGKEGSSTRLVRGVIDHFERQSDDSVSRWQAGDYAVWAAAYEFLGDRPRALEIVTDGLERFPQADDLQRAATDVAASTQVASVGGTLEKRRLYWNTLTRLYERLTDRTAILKVMVDATNQRDIGDEAKRFLADEETRHGLPPQVMQKLADLAIIQGDLSRARALYTKAIDRDPQLDGCLNNLAFLTANTEPVDLHRALELADQAVRLQPDNAHYLETRGQIQVLRQQWAAAIDDLSRAVNGMPTKWEIHRSLAQAYAAVGNQPLAQVHDRQYQTLRDAKSHP